MEKLYAKVGLEGKTTTAVVKAEKGDSAQMVEWNLRERLGEVDVLELGTKPTYGLLFNCFAVPNQARQFKEFPAYAQRKISKELSILNIPYAEDDMLIQVWIFSKTLNQDNLTDHGYPRDICELFGIESGYAPGYLPLNVLKDVKEGDEIELSPTNGVSVRIKCEQLPYRYGSFGDFSEAVEYAANR